MPLQQRKIMYDGDNFDHYYFGQYIPLYRGNDKLSKSLLSFKNGQSLHKQAWTECTAEAFKSKSELRGSLVVRALGHEEMKVAYRSTKSMDYLCTKLAHATGGSYSPECLVKTRSIGKLTTLKKIQREDALYKTYKFIAPDRVPKNIVIVDDIITTGATICSVIDSILKVLPSASITVFTLAATDHTSVLNEHVQISSSSYTWEPNTGWMQVEEDSPDYGEALAQLKAHINNNFFG